MVRKRKPIGRPRTSYDPVDVHVGSRLEALRALRGLSRSALARELGLSYQQVDKYERGANRISSSRLFDLCRVLDIPIGYFFDEMIIDTRRKRAGATKAGVSTPASKAPNQTLQRETNALVHAYYKIGKRFLRRRLVDLVRSIGSV
jgi:transcriptional regulator with XRE-family HTH domain